MPATKGKKNQPAAVVIESLPEVTISDETPIVIEDHSVIRRWREERPLTDDAAPAENNIITEELPPDDPNKIQVIVDAMAGENAVWSLTVSKLKNYARDGQRGVAARTHQGTIPIPDGEYLRSEQYIDDIQRLYADGTDTNYFHVIIKRNSVNYRHLPNVIAVDPLPQHVRAAMNPAVETRSRRANNFEYPQPAPTNPMEDMLAMLQKFQQMQRIFQSNQPQPAPAPAPTGKAAVISALVENGNLFQEITDELRSALHRKSDGSRETTFMDLALRAIETDLPGKLIAGIRDLIIEARNSALPAAPTAGQAPVIPNAPPRPAATSPVASMPPEMILLNFAVQACANPAEWPPEKAAQWITQFEETRPTVTPFIEMFLGMQPTDCLSFMAQSFPEATPITQQPHALDWIAKLQAELQPEDNHGQA